MDGEPVSSIDTYEAKVLAAGAGAAVEVVVNRQGMDEYLRVSCSVTAGILE